MCADIHDASEALPARSPRSLSREGPAGRVVRTRWCHPLGGRILTNTLTGTGYFPPAARTGQFRNEDDAGPSQRTVALSVEETVLLARRPDRAALRHRAASFRTYVESEGIFRLWMPAGPQGKLPITPF